MDNTILLETILQKMPLVGKWQRLFLYHLFFLFVQIPGRINFMQMGRYGKYNESSYRRNFSKSFDFQLFNKKLIETVGSSHYVIAFDPTHIRKSGKSTFGKGKFWSGCDSAMRQGLELGGFAVCDIDNATALHLEGFQTPSLTELKKEDKNLLSYYTDLWIRNAESFEELSGYGCVDAYFSKYHFIENVCTKTNMHIVSRLRDDAHLRYLFRGERTGKRGRPKLYDGKVDVKNPDLNYFKLAYSDEKMRIYEATLNAKALKRTIKLALTQFVNEKGEVVRKKLYFCTDINLPAWYIVKYYQNRFQIEFLYRDANQFTGLEQCQARDKEKLHFHFNTALTTVSVMKALHYLNIPKEERKSFSMASLKVLYHNELLLSMFFETFGINPKQHINNPKLNQIRNFGVLNAKT
jgi:hypothetical protein